MRRLGAGIVFAIAAGCASAPQWKVAPHDRYIQRAPKPKLHDLPKKSKVLDTWYLFSNTTFRPLSKALNPAGYLVEPLDLRPVLDINEFGQVIDSVWFKNRITRGMAAEEVAGINIMRGPAPGPLLVVGGKVEGATPGLIIEDADSIRYLVKFDPPAFPQLASSAEVIATRFLYAAGYHVPDNFLTRLEISRLVLGPDAKRADEYGDPVEFDERALAELLDHVNPYPNGTVKVLLSRLIDGTPIGPFSYRGVRSDDPNDHIPHERRRSLRGLKVFAAWLNNTDVRASNSLDVFIEEREGLGYVKHYLLDFGDSLGSAGTKPKYKGQGYEGRLDWGEVAKTTFSLGFYYPYWLPMKRNPSRSVGTFEAEVFDFWNWKPSIPNPAFDAADEADLLWAGSILARFTAAHLRATIDAVDYSESGAADVVYEVLRTRQLKILAAIFKDRMMLEDPRVVGEQLVMTDLRALHEELRMTGLLSACSYEVIWNRSGAGDEVLQAGVTDSARFELWQALAALRERAQWHEDPFLTVKIRDARGGSDSFAVHLRVTEQSAIVVGLER